MRRSATRQVALLIIGAFAALAIAACGGSSSSSSSSGSAGGGSSSSSSSAAASSGGGGGSSSSTAGLTFLSPAGQRGIMPGTGAYAAAATKAGKVAAKAAGGPTSKLPKGTTVGVINFLNGIQSSDRLADTVTFAAHQLGWKTIVCDGKGTPSVFVSCGNSLLAQGAKAMIAIAEEPGQLNAVLVKAKSQGVPVTQCGGGAEPTGNFAGNYGPDEVKAGKLLAAAIDQKLAGQSGAKVVIHNFPAEWANDRTKQFVSAVQASGGKVKIGAQVTTDASNIVPFTQNAVSDEITQVPDAKAYWFAFDTTGQIGATVLAAKYAGKTFPDRPLVATFHGDPATLTLVRSDKINIVSDTNYDASCWVALDQTAENLARGRKENPANQPKYPVIGDPMSYQIITKANVPPEGQYFKPKTDVPSFFISKWKAEFGQ